MVKDRITFLYFLFNETKIKSIVEARVSNSQYDTTKIIGETKSERKMILSAIYNKYIKILPHNV